MMFIITGWLAALYCILSVLSFAGSDRLAPGQRILGALISFAVGTWIIKAISMVG